jgi:Fur family ferric uptake transcriptional regulator
MKPIHHQEKEQFEKLFRQEQIDHFDDRFKVLEAFLQTENHVTVDELTRIIANQGHELSPDFIRDTLRLMDRYGFAQKNRFDNGIIRWEHRHLGQHHDHMVCTKCRQIVEFENPVLERLQAEIAAAHGFHMLQHRMEIYGICAQCQKERVQVISLANARPGERLVIEDLSGGIGSRMRLMSMGLRVGDAVEVITNHGQGQLVVALDFKRYSLGRGLAEKIWVRPQLVKA